MRTENKYNIEFAGTKRSTWKRRVGCWLWTVIACVLAWWAIRMIWAVAATLGAQAGYEVPKGTPMLRAAGFGVPEWLAVGIVVCVVLGVLARLWWGKVLDADEASAFSDERWDPYAGDGRMVSMTADEPWVVELMGFFARRNSLVTAKQCRQIRALCVPRHRMDLVMLDAFMRRELGLRLFVTTLMEVQAICAKGDVAGAEAQAGKPMLREGGAA